MSDAHPSSDTESTVSSALSTMLMVGIPLALIVMLAVSGIAFVGGMGGDRNAPVETKAAAPAPVAVASPAAAAPAEGSATPGAVPDGIDPAQWALGKKTFATCAACHGTDGTGLKTGPSLMAPSLVGSETLLGDPDQPILVVLKGIKKETVDYLGMMAALGALPDENIAAVLTFLRNNWGNKAPPISTEQVSAARAKFSDVNAPAGVPRAEIDAILQAHK